MQTVLITGGTGMVGKALSKHLVNNGYKVIILSRNLTPLKSGDAGSNIRFAKWDVNKQEIDIAALQEADHIIHLAGAGVMEKKWTARYKKEIISSRVDSARLIIDSLRENVNKVKKIISASAVGWYRESDNVHTEEEASDKSFLGETCRLWEESITPATALNKQLVKFRIGIVLSKEGGALKEFIRPLQFGVAAILGNGKQVISWIHIDDLCRLFLFAIENNEMNGVYNAVAPKPVSNKTLTLTLAKKRNRFYIPLHVPTFILKLVLGGRSVEILRSNAVSCKKVIAAGFNFQYDRIDKAMQDILSAKDLH
jgi:uncharacterized protein (TIGR01777 family)